MTRLEVKVLQKHIKNGIIGRAAECAIAQVVKMHNPKLGVFVMGGHCGLDIGGIIMNMPEVADKFIDDFDRKQKVSPFKFMVKVPDKHVEKLCKLIKGNPNLKLIMK